MKIRIFSMFLSIGLILSMFACGNTDNLNDNNSKPSEKGDKTPLMSVADAENSEESIPFVAAKPVSLYPIYDGYGDYEKKVTVIHSVEELTQYLEAINALAAGNKSPIDDTECVYGKELLQTYDNVYFAEKVLWLIVQDVSGSPGVSVTDICKQTDAKGKVSYTVTVEYIWNADGAMSDDVGTSELFILETAAEEDMRQDNIRVYKMNKDE